MLVVGVAGRCGSSLVCQMLAAGGMHVLGESPWSFEDPRQLGDEIEREELMDEAEAHARDGRGCAVKWLEPLQAPIPRREGLRLIMAIRRDKREQAASISKFGNLVGGCPRLSPGAQAALALRLAREQAEVSDAAQRLPEASTLTVAFEDVLSRADLQVERIRAFLAPVELQAGPMARVVRPRGPGCYPGLLEAELVGGKA